MLCYIIIFSMLLMTAVKVQAQCERPIFGENRILTDNSNQQIFPDGSTVKVKCSTGYVPTATTTSRSITCNGTHWSDVQLYCQKKLCGNPGEILNGYYKYEEEDGVLFGAVITAECNEGYQLAGYSQRNCREGGWDGRAPECEVVKCPKPPSITDGVFKPEEEFYEHEEHVTYSCNEGLHLIGPSELACSSNGTFQPAPPRCQLVTCDRPDIPNADRIQGKSPPYTYGNFVRYQCKKGYEMEGSGSLTCTEDGWDPHPPTCTVVKCSPPPVIFNGQFNPKKEFYEYEQTVTFSCNKGFRLYGASTRSCTESGRFQTPPKCLEMTCDEPRIEHGFIIRDDHKSTIYEYDSTVRVQCIKGYEMVGSDHLTCKENGWNPPPPQCRSAICDTPVIPNGAVSVSRSLYKYDDQIKISCNKGYKIEGSDILTCTDHGWSPSLPHCFKMTCDEPRIEHGFIIRDDHKSTIYEYDSTVRVQCIKGYEMVGSDYLTCKENGWNPPPPQCRSGYLPLILGLVAIPILIICICLLVYWCTKTGKYKQSEKNLKVSKAENCLLVSMSTTNIPAEEARSTSIH